MNRAEAWDRYARVLEGPRYPVKADPVRSEYEELQKAQTVLLRALYHLQNTKPYSLYVTRFDAMSLISDRVKELDADLQKNVDR